MKKVHLHFTLLLTALCYVFGMLSKEIDFFVPAKDLTLG